MSFVNCGPSSLIVFFRTLSFFYVVCSHYFPYKTYSFFTRYEAYLKAMIGTGFKMPKESILLTVTTVLDNLTSTFQLQTQG